MQALQQYNAEYKGYIRRDGAMSHSWILTLGVTQFTMEKDYKIYPANYHQEYKNLDIYGDISKNILIKRRGMFDINLMGSYTKGDGTLLNESNPIITGALKLNTNLLNHDFAYRTADRSRVGGGIKYSHFIKPEKGTVVYGGINYVYQFLLNEGNLDNILNGVLPGTNRSLLSFSIGLNF
jgi:hypothetical protein